VLKGLGRRLLTAPFLLQIGGTVTIVDDCSFTVSDFGAMDWNAL
jgi:hypothetical protein